MARWCYRRKWLVIVLWVLALVGLGAGSGVAGSKYANVFELPGTESAQVLKLMDKAFPERSGESDSVVWHVDQGSVRDAAVQQKMTATLDRIKSGVADVGTIGSPYAPEGAAQISKDGRTAYATVTFTKLGNLLKKEEVQKFVDTARAAGGAGLRVEVGGNSVAQYTEAPQQGLSELVGIAAAAVVLFLAFGSLYGMLLPIVTALFGIGTASSAIVLLSHGMDVAEFAPMLAMLVGLGVGIDYALFIVTRHRKGILRGRTPEDAAVTAVNTSGRAVLFAGGTVCIALLGMFAMGLSFLNGVAVAAALTVVTSVAAAITLLPAMLGVLGIRVLSRRQRRKLAANGPEPAEETGTAARWSSFLERHPRSLAVVAVVIMGALAVPTFSLRLGSSDQGNNPSTTTTRQAYDLLAGGFGEGFNGPLTILAEVKSDADQAAVRNLVVTLGQTKGIAFAAAMPMKPGPGIAVIKAVPTTSPQAAETSDLIDHLRADVVPAAEKGSTMQAYVGGQTAMFKDFASVLMGKLPLFIGVIIALGFVLLLVAFRSLLVPLTAALMNLIAAAASFGLLVAIFQWGWGGEALAAGRAGPIEAFLPVIMLSLLFGLSMDYQVFLVSRMHEEWVHTKDNARAVRVGLAETSRVINSAAVIMICVFGAFMLSGQRVLAMFGIGLAGAVALDAFILRTVLVPSLMHLSGNANWWLPGWLDKRLPHLAVEAAEDPVEGPAGAAPGSAPVHSAASPASANGGPAVRGTVRGSAGLPIPRSELTLIAADGRQVGRITAADDGTYTLPTPGSGSYVLVANADGHHPQTASVMTSDRPVDCDLRLSGTGTLTGTVRTAKGDPVDDARVVLQDADGKEVGVVHTGKDGGYAFANLYPGRYTLLTMGYPPFPATVTVSGDRDGEGGDDLDLELSHSRD
ncbi:MMPL family transporter [Streptomyces sp. H10-C2]|uniref:MMPL family transporter n=1 Tax=unclassified Streptomyces TaxID=2593676 RepID=UPI0024B9FCB7|nr:MULTISPECIES: MMPL family transporter [unclassified Streptomyces]MDJ0340527.1 MMPL family transporter [Streptomyces sp. PH10-H1]MDJ0370175.1 MMPL family transporter [Streptomyces sp. H10-C2]